MSSWLPWQCAQVSTILVGYTGERASLGGKTPCAPWQEMQVATLVSPAASALPWREVRYWAS